MPLQTVAGRIAQFGFAKQSNGTAGTAVLPSSSAGTWIKWRQGSMVSPKMEINHEFEGDGNRGESLAYKKLQYGMGKLIFAPRPTEFAATLAAFSGLGSDTVTGVGPYTHVITPQQIGNNAFYTLYMQLPGVLGSNTYYLYTQDAFCHGVTLTASSSDPVLKLDTEWSGGQSTAASPTAGGAPTTTYFVPDGPFYFFSLNSNVTLPIASIQGAIRDISIKFETELSPADFQTETVYPLPYVAGNMIVTGDMTVLWQDGGIAAYAYFGGASGTGDSATLPTGQVQLGFGCATNAAYTATLNFPNCTFETAEFEPDLSGKPIEQKLTFHALRYPQAGGAATSLYTATLLNGNSTAYAASSGGTI